MKQYDEAFSGLEAAIVVIAFVVVAVVFGMAVLGTGFFATEEAKKTTTSGYKMASSTIYMEGGVYAYLRDGFGSNSPLDDVQFSAAIPETGLSQDLNDLIIVYTHSKDTSIVRKFEYGGAIADPDHFGVDGSPVMLPGERRNFRLDQVDGPIPGGWFTIEFKPKVGASTFVTYHLPDSFQGGSVLT
ncbi:MAG: hypothetical protein GX639_17610 [Fibrobacter sp.]|nr:hypothetical protein [Fibrobacter sp.]